MGLAVRTDAGEVEIGTESCFQELVAKLRDPEPQVRLLAVCGLAASGDERAVLHVVLALEDPDAAVRERAAMALGKIGDPRAAPALLAAATDTDRALHRAAVAALGELGPVAIDLLAEELRSVDAADRVRAAIALGETRDVAAVAPLTVALEDGDPEVRRRAREALEKIRESRVF